MLSRIANSLFWMGRYLERAEHTARYARVHYCSSLDAPLVQKKEFVMESSLNLSGLLYEYKKAHGTLEDEKVLYTITLQESNPLSIRACVNSARENARGARDSLSSELWESINRFYHYVNNYSEADLNDKGIYNFTDKVVENCAIVNGYVHKSLIHNEVWSFIHLGMHLERANQITRILIAKTNDMGKAATQKLGKVVENYQCVTLLKSAEAFDMSRTYYKAVPNYHDSLEFLILNNDFPRSICYNLTRMGRYLDRINHSKLQEKDSLEFTVGKICATLHYLTIQEIEGDVLIFLNNMLLSINKIGELIEKKYLNY